VKVDLQRLEALRKAWQTAPATSVGLSHQLVQMEMERNRAAAFAESPRRAGESEAETNERRNSEAIAIGESLPQKFRRQSSTAADRFRIRHRPFGLGHELIFMPDIVEKVGVERTKTQFT
jgi:hypothetical protein